MAVAVGSDVGAISCGATCSGDYDDGTVGDVDCDRLGRLAFHRLERCLLGDGTCSVTMSQARAVTANFVAVYTLSVTKSGSGGGGGRLGRGSDQLRRDL